VVRLGALTFLEKKEKSVAEKSDLIGNGRQNSPGRTVWDKKKASLFDGQKTSCSGEKKKKDKKVSPKSSRGRGEKRGGGVEIMPGVGGGERLASKEKQWKEMWNRTRRGFQYLGKDSTTCRKTRMNLFTTQGTS